MLLWLFYKNVVVVVVFVVKMLRCCCVYGCGKREFMNEILTNFLNILFSLMERRIHSVQLFKHFNTFFQKVKGFFHDLLMLL